MEIDQVQGGFDNLKKVCYFKNAAIFQHDRHNALYMYMSQGGGRVYSEEFWN